ncbi:TIGR03759 family integrating conjugative element protein [Stutzerimonas stutzeri]|uniref:TIGR03759 family integrating conjugative element protein n=1 Tax=Stutzerimonas stutzeri TaxID=316 RepID=UPI002448AB87|nr:TIGR03759 family integrating conjugative element protein [Stutzerimonas stutzeri]MDH0425372.1 TIGR03759 family integrating conjugative element protein [Stutzerimonas stutzeri]
MKQRRIAPVLIVLLTSSLAQGAETRTADNTPSHEQPTAIERTDEQHARSWGLSTEEWARYRALMQGPLGIYSPNLDPLTALGIEARSEQERQRYAELQVQAEAHRVEKLLAYQRAYDDAWQRLHANMPRVILPDAGPAFSPVTPAANERIAVFVKDACAACDQTTLRLQAAGMEFDIYVVDSRADDARIRAWAQRIGIDPAKVRSGQVTLNHDSGRWLSLGLQGDLPAVVRQVGGQWQRQP